MDEASVGVESSKPLSVTERANQFLDRHLRVPLYLAAEMGVITVGLSALYAIEPALRGGDIQEALVAGLAVFGAMKAGQHMSSRIG